MFSVHFRFIEDKGIYKYQNNMNRREEMLSVNDSWLPAFKNISILAFKNSGRTIGTWDFGIRISVTSVVLEGLGSRLLQLHSLMK